ncbi:hypothetical protein HZC35_05465 [Candidatus Saganbacteria bacterium]|nr:hypothetical protein [Candidatus Saganbacteria bacterium]
MSVIGAFEIIGIRDAGDLANERVLLRALEPADLQYYVVMNTKKSGGRLSILNDKVFWFPEVSINAGEFVRLYTKAGQRDRVEAKYGEEPAIYQNFYWGETGAIWGDEESNAVTVFKINTWNTA